ncbi:MAG TPA: hypothetical protein VM509_08635 [Planctomycetota bacterium]|nr:hypothetical protein [Planctomycetota bacterium]
MKQLATLALALAGASPALAQDFIVPANTTVNYDTTLGPIVAFNFIVQPNGVLRVTGPNAFHVRASHLVRIEGLIDLSGFDNPGVNSLNTTNIPEPGSPGGPGAGGGGTGSPLTTQSSPAGTDGFGPPLAPRVGGRGGESGISVLSLFVDARRPGGGGGGILAADQGVHPDPYNTLNIGLVATAGKNGAPTALGVSTLTPPPRGGGMGDRVFLDADPTNDFYGVRLLTGGGLQIGELIAPVAGAGGGGGGDAINGLVWPPPVFIPTDDEKGAGGGGGGGLGIIVAPTIALAGQGKIRCDGGKGGGGENTNFLDRVGGGSGGGSGGYLILQARVIDLRSAAPRSITALGGRGGPGKDSIFNGIDAGGNGGPGVIGLHMPPNAAPLVPVGKTIGDMTAPHAIVLLPDRRL